MSNGALLCYLNGDYLPREQACLPLMDRGLLFGDSVYEVVRTYGGRPYLLEEHLTRLEAAVAHWRVRAVEPLRRWSVSVGESHATHRPVVGSNRAPKSCRTSGSVRDDRQA